jgi:hypothetical protein
LISFGLAHAAMSRTGRKYAAAEAAAVFGI